MDWYLISLGLAGISLILAYHVIIRDIKNGLTPVAVASWLVWLTQDILMTLASLVKRVEKSAIMLPLIWAIGSLIVLTIILRREKFAGFKFIDKLCLALGALGLGAWMFTAIRGNAMPELGLWGAALSLTAGCVPTFKEEFLKPGPTKAWLLFVAGSAFDLLAIRGWNFYDIFIPVVGIVLQVGIILSVLLGRTRNSILSLGSCSSEGEIV